MEELDRSELEQVRSAIYSHFSDWEKELLIAANSSFEGLVNTLITLSAGVLALSAPFISSIDSPITLLEKSTLLIAFASLISSLLAGIAQKLVEHEFFKWNSDKFGQIARLFASLFPPSMESVIEKVKESEEIEKKIMKVSSTTSFYFQLFYFLLAILSITAYLVQLLL